MPRRAGSGSGGEDPCTVTGIRAIDEPGEGLVELEITVGCNRASLWKDQPGEHPWFGEFRHRVRLIWGQGQMVVDPDGSIRFDAPRGQLVIWRTSGMNPARRYVL